MKPISQQLDKLLKTPHPYQDTIRLDDFIFNPEDNSKHLALSVFFFSVTPILSN